jgi:hypothetical protein
MSLGQIRGHVVHRRTPHTVCDSAGPAYSPIWFLGDIEADENQLDIDEAEIAKVEPGRVSLSEIMTRTPKPLPVRGRPKGTKNKPGHKAGTQLSEATRYFIPLIEDLRLRGFSVSSILDELNKTRHPYRVPTIATVYKILEKMGGRANVAITVRHKRAGNICAEAEVYFKRIIKEGRDAGKTYREIADEPSPEFQSSGSNWS